MEPKLRKILEKIHAAPHRAVVYVTGGAAQAITWLGELPGSSRTLIEAAIPYSPSAVADLLGHTPKKFTSPETARALAEKAYERALGWTAGAEPVLGIGCTASLATLRPKRGKHRVIVAARESNRTTTYDVTLTKSKRTRAEEDSLASRLVLQALADACGLKADLGLKLMRGERVQVKQAASSSAVSLLLDGKIQSVLVQPDGKRLQNFPAPQALLPGAFNPWHEAHRGLAQAASQQLGKEVIFELAVKNVDKPPLGEAEVARRRRQFTWRSSLVLTAAATFREKAELFPGSTFVVGYDTAERILALRYYGNKKAMHSALKRIQELGCRFLVAARLHGKACRTLDDLAVPSEYSSLFSFIPEQKFRMDISSGQLRAN
ncbi:MAG: hypothetical protein O6850_02305 [Acidobacteria bacterium]|nr:hypothetical protein [Acidobacteriota bacterium]